jgi:hypothetical protein
VEEDVRKRHKTRLALRITQGQSSTAWAPGNEVPLRSGLPWSRDPKVRRPGDARRHRVANPVIGPLASLVMKAADGVSHVA